MENVTDALYMAFAVLAFVIALSISIFAFGEVRAASQSIIDARDKTTMYNYVEETEGERLVTKEDIIPTLYRAYKENFVVRFEGIGNLFQIKDRNTDEWYSTSTLDFESQNLGKNDDKNFLEALLYGKMGELENNYRFNSFKYLQSRGLYDILEDGDGTFIERVGIYYQDNSSEDSDDVNRTEKRMITYTKH